VQFTLYVFDTATFCIITLDDKYLLELCAKLVQILTNATKCRTPAHSSASTASAHTYANVPRAMSKRQTIERARSATVSLCSPCFLPYRYFELNHNVFSTLLFNIFIV